MSARSTAALSGTGRREVNGVCDVNLRSRVLGGEKSGDRSSPEACTGGSPHREMNAPHLCCLCLIRALCVSCTCPGLGTVTVFSMSLETISYVVGRGRGGSRLVGRNSCVTLRDLARGLAEAAWALWGVRVLCLICLRRLRRDLRVTLA